MGILNRNKDSTIPEGNQDIAYLRAQDEAKDNTRISRYLFLLTTVFLGALFASYFWALKGEGESLLSSELVHFIAGSLFTGMNVILDRYFKSGSQKDAEKNLAVLVAKLQEQQDQQNQQKEIEQEEV